MYSKLSLVLFLITSTSYTQYKNIIFDFGGVILAGGPEHGGSLVKKPCFKDWMMGKLSLDELRGKLYEDFSQEEVDTIIGQIFSSNRPWIDETLTIIYKLKQQGYRLYLLSNLAREVHDLYKDHPLFTHFDGIVCSYQVGLLKPDLLFYNHVLKEYELEANESVFIDDALVNVEAAREVGITGIWYKSGILRSELIAIGIIL